MADLTPASPRFEDRLPGLRATNTGEAVIFGDAEAEQLIRRIVDADNPYLTAQVNRNQVEWVLQESGFFDLLAENKRLRAAAIAVVEYAEKWVGMEGELSPPVSALVEALAPPIQEKP